MEEFEDVDVLEARDRADVRAVECRVAGAANPAIWGGEGEGGPRGGGGVE